MSGNKHFRRALVLGLVISALLIGVGFWQSITMGIVCLVGCGALLAIFCLYTRNQTREIRRLSDYLTTLVNGTAPLLVPANNQEGELSLLENNIYKTARKLQTQAELMQKDKTYLADALADVSHQLKTPITSMTVMTDLLLEEDLPAEKRLEFLKGISAQLEKMQWMITTLLKISKFDAGTAVLHKEPVELAAVVEQALAPFIIQAELRQMTLAVDCRQGQFLGDRLWTVEAVQNIVKKALWAIRVIVICVVPDDDVRVGAIIFDEGYLREPFHRVLFVGLWSIHGKNLLQAAVLSNGWMLAPYRKMRMGSLKPSFEIRVSLILSV